MSPQLGTDMSIKYNVTQNGKQIETSPKGVLDIDETIDYFNRIKVDPEIKQGAIEIVNFKDVTDFKLTFSETKKITESYSEPKAIQMIYMTIFICETGLAYGVGRMLHTLHDIVNPSHKVVLVRSEGESEKEIARFQSDIASGYNSQNKAQER